MTITDLVNDFIHCLYMTENHTAFKYQILQHTEQFEKHIIWFGWLKETYILVKYQ